MSTFLKLVAFDADDTLWENETFYRLTEERFTELLADFAEADHLSERLIAAERRNLARYGFGIKGFTLSMIETAIEVTDNRVPAEVIGKVLETGREMLAHPLHLLDGVTETLEMLAKTYRLALITKGDLFDQERKLAASGLGDLFRVVEIVSDKTPSVYTRIFREQAAENTAMMVGNSVKSDVIPAITAGGYGIYVPHDLEWSLEAADPPRQHKRFREISNLSALPALIAEVENANG